MAKTFEQNWKKVGTTQLSMSFGDLNVQFNTIGKYHQTIDTEIKKAVHKSLIDIAEKFREALKQSVYFQSLDLVPLSKKYAEQKERKGLDPRILISSGEYIETIEITENKNSLGFLEIIVQAPDTEHSETKVNMRLLARVLEYGSKVNNIPARPHWRPVMKEFIALKSDLAKEAADTIALRVRNALEKNFGKKFST